ncbi:carnitine palmitoyltransferase 2 [Capsaspora owczarzaki ATCC 30864]|uniref:Carnitine palmitoyltransferase 2 n=1 Tax=Capsaspora owczarzaki (strain ATCC 30864) TaxID=595528 RepID=A0A0D2WJK9_CAPO3|nr:carnitine palmitoyltransferase 2 [Capsaspora owczarzaki ATCC 30864]KJE90270.1 carnitine palmitoyltransferase 2 [Capsaspora owczarzaki ATCC 30864]|eukprot:XP_004364472.1 carnitine palmitoyltransferase 2 [Capsaspora owczarzaki ATCC 30864]
MLSYRGVCRASLACVLRQDRQLHLRRLMIGTAAVLTDSAAGRSTAASATMATNAASAASAAATNATTTTAATADAAGNSKSPSLTMARQLACAKQPPRLPLPDLDTTLGRFVASASPLLPKDELAITMQAVNEFRETAGPELHAKVAQIAANHSGYPHSFVESFWDDMYLEGRWPLPINSNPFFLFKPDLRLGARTNGLARATSLTMATLRFIRKMRTAGLEPDMNGDTPYDMSQYDKLFNTTRIPVKDRDTLATYPTSRHIVVMTRGSIYSIDVMSNDHKIISESALQAQLTLVIADSKKLAATSLPHNGAERDVGALTAMQRNDWASARAQLEAHHPTNKATLAKIDSALFVVSLDDYANVSLNEKSKQLLHGTGSNRWFDKSLTLITFEDGAAGCNFEHAWGDGHTVLRFCHEIWCDTQQIPSGFSSLKVDDDVYMSGRTNVAKLDWVLSDRLASTIHAAHADYARFTANNDNFALRFDRFGKNVPKRAGISPDAFIQMAFQLAYYRQHHLAPSTYESCNTKHFLSGRTETIRSLSAESLAFIEKYDRSSTSSAEKQALLRIAAKAQADQAVRCRDGQGFDRHLFAMQGVARQLWGASPSKLPGLFVDPGFLKFKTIILSTSTLNGIFMDHAGFGAVSEHGYGLGYVAHNELLSINVASFRDSPHTDSAEYASQLNRTLTDLGELVSSSSQ